MAFVLKIIKPRELDSFEKLLIAVYSGDDNLVNERKVALVDNAKLGQLICAAGLPENRFALRSVCGLLEVESLVLCVDPVALTVLHLKFNVKRACLNPVDTGLCGVGEPCECCSNEHNNAQENCDCAGDKCSLGGLAVCHFLLLPSIDFKYNDKYVFALWRLHHSLK